MATTWFFLDSLKQSGSCCQEYSKLSHIEQEKYFQFLPGLLCICSVKWLKGAYSLVKLWSATWFYACVGIAISHNSKIRVNLLEKKAIADPWVKVWGISSKFLRNFPHVVNVKKKIKCWAWLAKFQLLIKLLLDILSGTAWRDRNNHSWMLHLQVVNWCHHPLVVRKESNNLT